jgi:hypothetical protein
MRSWGIDLHAMVILSLDTAGSLMNLEGNQSPRFKIANTAKRKISVSGTGVCRNASNLPRRSVTRTGPLGRTSPLCLSFLPRCA